MMKNYIIERRVAEEGLRESEAQFRSLFEQAAMGIVHVASNGKFLRVNKRFCEITGYTEQEILERAYQDITYPDDLYAQNEARKKVLDGETSSYRIEKRYIRKDGTIIWGNLTAGVLIRKPGGEPNYFVSVLEDITERKQAEEELRETEERYRAVFEQAADSIVVVDGDTGEIIEFNDSAHENLGYTREEFKKLEISDIDAIESPKDVKNHIVKVMKEGCDIF